MTYGLYTYSNRCTHTLTHTKYLLTDELEYEKKTKTLAMPTTACYTMPADMPSHLWLHSLSCLLAERGQGSLQKAIWHSSPSRGEFPGDD